MKVGSLTDQPPPRASPSDAFDVLHGTTTDPGPPPGENKGVRMKTVVYRALSKVFGGIALAVGIFALVAGLYAHSYVSGQLSQEKITMPAEASYKTLPQVSQDALKPYAGQPMNTGDEAQ